jgi:protease IV
MFAELTLSGSYRETVPQVKTLLRPSRGKELTYESFLRRCDAIRRDRRVTTVLVEVRDSFATATPTALEGLREALVELRDAGRELVFFASDYTDSRLYLASACSTRIIHPLGSVRCVGLARTNLFFRRLGDRLGIELQIVRRGKYKSALDRFRLDTIDPSTLEQYQRWLDVAATHLHETILTGYRKERAELDHLLGGHLLNASEAVERGWADRAVPLGTIRREWEEEKLKRRKLRVRKHIGRGKRVCVLFFEGLIVEGENRFNPILGQSIGSRTFVHHVHELRKDRKVKAVVLRINSGGGSAIASEDIREALVRLAETKPLVVSMGEVAGSGGYWISMTGSRVFAGHTTLTGSIGVINIAANVGNALAKKAVTHSTIRTHEHADASGAFRPLDDSELEQLDAQVESIYHEFLALVAKHRSLTSSEVDARAQGRVWSGSDALDQGLVDEIGGLSAALDHARDCAGLDRARIVFRPLVKYSFVERLIYSRGRSQGAAGTALATVSEFANRPLLLDPFSLPISRWDAVR